MTQPPDFPTWEARQEEARAKEIAAAMVAPSPEDFA